MITRTRFLCSLFCFMTLLAFLNWVAPGRAQTTCTTLCIHSNDSLNLSPDLGSNDSVYVSPDLDASQSTISCTGIVEVDFGWSPLIPTIDQAVTLAAEPWGSWPTTVVDRWVYMGGPDTLALDAAGRPHLVYYDVLTLTYAYHNGSDWIKETVETNLGHFTGDESIVVDAAGHPHIAYFDYEQGVLKYAFRHNSTWLVETVDAGWVEGSGFVSLALDPGGHPHMSYVWAVNYSYSELRYAWNDGSEWHIEAVAGDGDIWGQTSLALDSAGRPHISYIQLGEGIRHAWRQDPTEQSWQIQTVDSAGHAFNSLAIDPAGRLHLSYYDDQIKGLKYAYSDGSAWNVEAVDSIGSVGQWSSLALDSAGRPHISYHRCDDSSGNCTALLYAWRDGTTWYTGTVAQDNEAAWVPCGGPRRGTSLAIDPGGHPHILHFDRGSDLVYTWSDQNLPSPPITYIWDLGDGTVASGRVVTHAYTTTGAYTATVTATNCTGQSLATAAHVLNIGQQQSSAYLPLVFKGDAP